MTTNKLKEKMNQLQKFEKTGDIGSVKTAITNGRVIKVSLEQLGANKLNTQPIVHIDDLVEQIKNTGGKLLNMIQVRPLHDGEVVDAGVKYIIVGGHRRRKALELLGVKEVEVEVLEELKNVTGTDEKLAITLCNSQREETKENILLTCQAFEEVYNDKVASKEIEPNGNYHKEKWIGTMMNRSDRTIRRYLKEVKELENQEETETEKEQKTHEEIKKENDDKEVKALIRKLNAVGNAIFKMDYDLFNENRELFEVPVKNINVSLDQKAPRKPKKPVLEEVPHTENDKVATDEKQLDIEALKN